MLDRLLNLFRQRTPPPKYTGPWSTTRHARLTRNEEWRRLYEEERWTTARIAGRYNVSDSAVNVTLRRMGIAMRKKGPQRGRPAEKQRVTRADIAARNQEWKRLYEEEGLSSGQIAKRYGVPVSRVIQSLRKIGAAIRSHGDRDRERDAEIVRLRVEEHLTLEEIGKQSGITRERARQVLKRSGVDMHGAARARMLLTAKKYQPKPVRLCRFCGADYMAEGGWRDHQRVAKHSSARKDARDAAVAADYQAGLTVKAIMEKHDIDPATVSRAVKRNGVPMRRPNYRRMSRRDASIRKDAILADVLAREMTAAQIGAKHGCSDSWVCLVAKERGVFVSRRAS